MGLINWRIMATMVLFLLFTACSTPRGAGFQREVLAASDAKNVDGSPAYDFSVFEVTRDTLPSFANWPVTGRADYNWITRRTQPASLLIASGDTLKIMIWDTEANSLLTSPGERVAQLQDVRVSSTGRIFLPFVGEMKVSGMSPETARRQIENQLTQTVPSAQVQISVEPGRANTASLVSGVNTPGIYPLLDRDVTILSLIATGGGTDPDMANPQVRLMRAGAIYGTSISKLYNNPSLDTTLRGGDQVIVEEDERYFLSLGATDSESLHIFTKDDLTALDALSIIGGVVDARADPQGVLILREYSRRDVRSDGNSGPPMERVVFTLDLTSADGLFSAGKFPIMAGDLVYATESPLGAASTIFGVLGTVLTISGKL
jgi:polysaccharide export outer membrane protein